MLNFDVQFLWCKVIIGSVLTVAVLFCMVCKYLREELNIDLGIIIWFLAPTYSFLVFITFSFLIVLCEILQMASIRCILVLHKLLIVCGFA